MARPGRSRRIRLTVGLLAGAVFLAAVGLLIADQVRLHRQFDRDRAALRVTRQRTGVVSAQLGQLRHDLDLLGTQVGDDATALNQDTSQLKGARWALALTQANVTKENALITSLRTCLSGVEEAMNSLAVGQLDGTLSELGAVSSSCSAAAAAGD